MSQRFARQPWQEMLTKSAQVYQSCGVPRSNNVRSSWHRPQLDRRLVTRTSALRSLRHDDRRRFGLEPIAKRHLPAGHDVGHVVQAQRPLVQLRDPLSVAFCRPPRSSASNSVRTSPIAAGVILRRCASFTNALASSICRSGGECRTSLSARASTFRVCAVAWPMTNHATTIDASTTSATIAGLLRSACECRRREYRASEQVRECVSRPRRATAFAAVSPGPVAPQALRAGSAPLLLLTEPAR